MVTLNHHLRGGEFAGDQEEYVLEIRVNVGELFAGGKSGGVGFVPIARVYFSKMCTGEALHTAA